MPVNLSRLSEDKIEKGNKSFEDFICLRIPSKTIAIYVEIIKAGFVVRPRRHKAVTSI